MATVKNNNLIVKQPGTTAAGSRKPSTVKDYITMYKSEFAKVLPTGTNSYLSPDRFARIAITATKQTPGIEQCSIESIIGALMRAAQYGLEPNTPMGEAYLIPRGGDCQFQLGYKGLMTMAYRTGTVKNFESNIVHENDHCVPHMGTHVELDYVPALRDQGAAIGCYAGYHTCDGDFVYSYMPMEEILRHRQNTKAWKDHFDAMAKKTVIIELLKWSRLSAELSEAASIDSTVQTVDHIAPGGDVTITTTYQDEPAPEPEPAGQMYLVPGNAPQELQPAAN